MIGDIGGTNIRLQLVRLYHDNKNKKDELKPLIKFGTREYKDIVSVIKEYLSDVKATDLPRIGVIGMAGPVEDNKIETPVNIRHWPLSDGYEIAKIFKLDSFVFLNDFTAAGYGVSRLTSSDYTPVKGSSTIPLQEGAGSVKVVIGPGTGLG